jgi:hypothetical protein
LGGGVDGVGVGAGLGTEGVGTCGAGVLEGTTVVTGGDVVVVGTAVVVGGTVVVGEEMQVGLVHPCMSGYPEHKLEYCQTQRRGEFS